MTAAVSSCSIPHLPGKVWLQSQGCLLPLGLKMERVHLTLEPPCQLARSHSQRTQSGLSMVPVLVLGDFFFFYFFFFFNWKMSLWGLNVNWFILKL